MTTVTVPAHYLNLFRSPSDCLTCPISGCGNDCVHINGVEIHSPGQKDGVLRVTNEGGIHLDQTAINNERRGSKIVVLCECECGHCFTFSMLFHKGSTFLSAGVVPVNTFDETDEAAFPTTDLWRD